MGVSLRSAPEDDVDGWKQDEFVFAGSEEGKF
jgi:hypothetical protein